MFPRLAASRLVRAHPRPFSSSVPRSVARPTPPPALDPATIDALKATNIFQKASQDPDVLATIVKFVDLLRAHGIDTSKPPTAFQFTKVLLKSEIRDALEEVVKACDKAGISPMEMMQDTAKFAKLAALATAQDSVGPKS